jgi:glyoxylase-like metal-dependent hydrolase (beta-lactamase superfamily II)
MNDLEQRLHYPLGDALPESGRCIEVAPGIKWIRMALPFALNHINLWLLRDEMDGVAGWSVVDTCIHRDEAKAQWEDIFAHELEGLPILRVIVTHMHPDHIGLAHWLCERWNAPLWISGLDYQVARLACLAPTSFGGARTAAFFAQHGLNDAETQSKLLNRRDYFTTLVPSVPDDYHRLLDGQTLRIGAHTWRCISGYGHAPEHISTNVSVYESEPEADALALFLGSIDKFRPLPEATQVLPAHGKPFTGLHERIQQLHDHHRAHLDKVLEACRQQPCSAADIIPVLFTRAMDFHQTTFALGESVAHLHALWYAGKLLRTRGPDGVLRFSVASRVS